LAHLDIKLENILVGDDANLKLCDFGMVESIDADLTKRQGTEMYMAPEIIDKRHNETYKGVPADIFAMGVLLWILAFAQPPFSQASSRDRNFSTLQRKPEAFWRLHPCVKKQPEPIDEDLKLLLTSMLSRDIGNDKRPESLESVLEHQYFRKETELLNAQTNNWVDKASIQAQFREKLDLIQ
jgi:serine/threonine protein kinase